MLEKALSAAKAGVAQSDADLFEELRIPSVSALPEHRADVRRNAEWLVARLQKLGFKASLTDVEGGQPVLQAFKHEATAPARVPPRPKKPADESLF